MKEEDILLKKLGKENSFKVPDGYFENLTSEVMNKLPEKEKVAFKEEPVSTWTRLKPLLYMAAMFVGAALIIRVASTDHKPAAADDVAVTEVDTEVVVIYKNRLNTENEKTYRIGRFVMWLYACSLGC